MKSLIGSALLAMALAPALAGPQAPTAEGDHRRHPGFVDAAAFVALGDPDTTTVEVTLHGAMLRALTTWDPELKKLAGGLQSIHAVILDLGERGRLTRGRELVLGTEKKLLERGWERITRIKDEGTDVIVMALSDEERIQGLVVMVADEDDDGELVFANIAGDIDLAALAELGERMEIPGLDRMGE